ncbi:MAG: radical SAM protein [Anaerolineae bacterium]|nr:MAG: radical SAM protein [Anaerolineae bacterium]
MDPELQAYAANFIESTRDFIFVRTADNVIILRPNRAHHLNATATEMLHALYSQAEVDVAAVVRQVAARYSEPEDQVAADLSKLLRSVSLLLQDRVDLAPAVRTMRFGSHEHRLPVLSEIALTYRCNNRCFFCYASAPDRGREVPEMTTAEVKAVLDKIRHQAQVPMVSFTGGEPTLRADLPELIAHAKSLGMWANLITNGIRCADPDFVARLAEAGLDSAQVSLEAGDAATHDAVVDHPGAFEKTVAGVRALRAAGIRSHTNTTINARNRRALPALIDFVAQELGSEYLSMNMVIRTGGAVGVPDISYSEIGELALSLKAHAEEQGVRFVWYSPVPYCLFNPAAHGLGGQSCAAADGLLSVAPDGDVLPCSSFERGIGNLLGEGFETIWNRRSARYWRDKEFLPPGCRECDLAEMCCAACPLYWDERGDLAEIAPFMRPALAWEWLGWRLKRRFVGRVKGVGIG